MRRPPDQTKHGQARLGKQTLEYQAWARIKARCFNPKCEQYKNYGGRGITICDRWLHSFEAFFQDMGRRPPGTSLGRINNDGHYDPTNCAWQTPVEQANNTRRNRLLTHLGRTMTARQWERELGFGNGTLTKRLKDGWSPDEAISTPLNGRNKGRLYDVVRRIADGRTDFTSADIPGFGRKQVIIAICNLVKQGELRRVRPVHRPNFGPVDALAVYSKNGRL